MNHPEDSFVFGSPSISTLMNRWQEYRHSEIWTEHSEN